MELCKVLRTIDLNNVSTLYLFISTTTDNLDNNVVSNTRKYICTSYKCNKMQVRKPNEPITGTHAHTHIST
eukprot:m.117177 g.117177  ORF g.117177 m.117177 type:complete len:71 (+) comp12868_c0_seq1:1760-1972(+)